MKRNETIKHVIYLILIVIWMVGVYKFSAENGQKSSGTSTGITIKIVNIITGYKQITEEEKLELVQIIHPIIRKIAHYILYMAGGILIINYLDILKFDQKKKIIYSIIIGMLYAISDEIHQYFVPNREMQIKDVFIDTLGIITGVFLYITLKIILIKIFKKDKINI